MPLALTVTAPLAGSVALAELSVPRDREVLLRYYIGEEESTRICADLEIEGDHFYRVLSRARKRYRLLWEEQAQQRPHAPGAL